MGEQTSFLRPTETELLLRLGAAVRLSPRESTLPEQVTCWSMHQPYAGLVACGLKTLETRLRPWPAKARPYPATLLICSSLVRDGQAFDAHWERIKLRLMANAPMVAPSAMTLRADGSTWRAGVALALVDVVGCHPLVAEDEPLSWYWEPAGDGGQTRHAWELANLRRVAPLPVKGRQGFARTVPRADVEKALALWSAT